MCWSELDTIIEKLKYIEDVKPTNVKEDRDDPKYFVSDIIYSMVYQLAILSQRYGIFYLRLKLKTLMLMKGTFWMLFLIKNKKGGILFVSKKSSKSPLDRTRVQLLFGMWYIVCLPLNMSFLIILEYLRIKYSDFSHTKFVSTLNQKCRDAKWEQKVTVIVWFFLLYIKYYWLKCCHQLTRILVPWSLKMLYMLSFQHVWQDPFISCMI